MVVHEEATRTRLAHETGVFVGPPGWKDGHVMVDGTGKRRREVVTYRAFISAITRSNDGRQNDAAVGRADFPTSGESAAEGDAKSSTSFGGSGTTAQVVLEFDKLDPGNRRFTLAQLLE